MKMIGYLQQRIFSDTNTTFYRSKFYAKKLRRLTRSRIFDRRLNVMIQLDITDISNIITINSELLKPLKTNTKPIDSKLITDKQSVACT